MNSFVQSHQRLSRVFPFSRTRCVRPDILSRRRRRQQSVGMRRSFATRVAEDGRMACWKQKNVLTPRNTQEKSKTDAAQCAIRKKKVCKRKQTKVEKPAAHMEIVSFMDAESATSTFALTALKRRASWTKNNAFNKFIPKKKMQ